MWFKTHVIDDKHDKDIWNWETRSTEVGLG